MKETHLTENLAELFYAKEELKANREFKSSIFSMLFADPKELLSLYNAMNHSHYSNPDELIIVTLFNVLYIGMKNDTAFLLGYYLNLYEHQSTPNPNMPLRHLFYVVREYTKLVDLARLYRSTPVKIPNPRFVVFYNGKEKQPERQILKLSDLFLQAEEEPMLELKVDVLNINAGYNEELKEDCTSLKNYCLFVERVRQYREEEGLSLDKAINRAVEECIQEGILKDFLNSHRAEVVTNSILEFTFEDWLKMMQEDFAELNEGREKLNEGREKLNEDREKLNEDREKINEDREKNNKDREEIDRTQEEMNRARIEIERERTQVREEVLRLWIGSLKSFLPDFEAVFKEVISKEEYAHYTREQLMEYYNN